MQSSTIEPEPRGGLQFTVSGEIAERCARIATLAIALSVVLAAISLEIAWGDVDSTVSSVGYTGSVVGGYLMPLVLLGTGLLFLSGVPEASNAFRNLRIIGFVIFVLALVAIVTESKLSSGAVTLEGEASRPWGGLFLGPFKAAFGSIAVVLALRPHQLTSDRINTIVRALVGLVALGVIGSAVAVPQFDSDSSAARVGGVFLAVSGGPLVYAAVLVALGGRTHAQARMIRSLSGLGVLGALSLPILHSFDGLSSTLSIQMIISAPTAIVWCGLAAALTMTVTASDRAGNDDRALELDVQA